MRSWRKTLFLSPPFISMKSSLGFTLKLSPQRSWWKTPLLSPPSSGIWISTSISQSVFCLMFSFSIFSLQTFKWDSRNFIPKNVLEQNRQGKWWCILICILRSSSDLNSSVQRAQSCSRSRFFPRSFLSLLFVSLLETFEFWQWNLQMKYYKWLNEI